MNISEKRFKLEKEIEKILTEFTIDTGYTVQELKIDRYIDLKTGVNMFYEVLTEVIL